MKPRERPVTPSGADKSKNIPDENKWIWDLYESFRKELEVAILPLNDYMASFDAFKDILQLKPDDYVLAIEMEETQREIVDIKAEVAQVKLKAEQLKKLIPSNIQVSFFNIQC